jgi:branched-chain amino acid transport system substrate-binding protein
MGSQTRTRLALALVAISVAAAPAMAQQKDMPGVSASEIRIGQTMPYSGPASAYGTLGRADLAYFAKINAEGGINGRKISLISLDDAYNPSKTVEQTRRLVEQDEVLLTFHSLGTATNNAVQRYLNQRKVPQLFVSTGATKWGDPEHFPWTMGWQPSYQTEGRIYARYLLATKPDARIAVLYQNDDYGRDYLKGLRDGLGDKAERMIVAQIGYEVSQPTVDSEMATLKSTGADTFFDVATPKFAAMAIRKAHDLNWTPLHLLNSVSASVGAVLRPAGLEASIGIVSAGYLKDPTDPQWRDDPAYRDWLAWMKRYYPEGDVTDSLNVSAYSISQTLVQVLRQCGDDLSRENVMRQAANLHFEVPMLMPGITVNTSPTDFFPVKQMRLRRFDGKGWVLFGETIGG